jgi:hypothetical protein
MKKLDMLGIISGAALLTAAPFSLQWSQENVALSLDSAEAQTGQPPAATSVAGVSRRAHRRAYRRAAYAAAAAGVPDTAMAHITAIALRTIPATTRRSRTRAITGP